MDSHTTRRRVNDAFLRDLLADWQQHGAEVIEAVRRETPGTYMKVMALLMPKEMKIESASAILSRLSDEQLHAMIVELEERIAAKLSGEDAKVISAEASPAPTTLSPPTRYRRQPKSSPERLAYAREYMRKRRAAAKAARQLQTDCTESVLYSQSSPPKRDFSCEIKERIPSAQTS